MNALRRLTMSISQRGLAATAVLAARKAGTVASKIGDCWFDVRYGTDTVHIIELKELDIASLNKPFGMRYEVTRARPLKKLLNTLSLPKDGVLVDFGSGKGRVLMIAAEHGFKKVRGIEFSHQLNVAARKNLAIFQEKIGREFDVEIFEMDVIDYDIREDENIFFMFNPFYSEIMERVIDNIAGSLEKHPRKAWLIYQYPECRGAIDDRGVFSQTGRYYWGGCEFIVYENR